MIIFVVAQLFINFKHGMVITPFFHYGMYSHQIKMENSYEVFEIKVNNKPLKGSDFTPHQWDKILLPLVYCSHLPQSNGLYENEVKRLLAKLHISTKEKDFLQQCSLESFEKWYNKYLETILGEPVYSSEIQLRVYQYNDARLLPTDSVTNLAQLCH